MKKLQPFEITHWLNVATEESIRDICTNVVADIARLVSIKFEAKLGWKHCTARGGAAEQFISSDEFQTWFHGWLEANSEHAIEDMYSMVQHVFNAFADGESDAAKIIGNLKNTRDGAPASLEVAP